LKPQKCRKIKIKKNILDRHMECKRLLYGSAEQLESVEIRRNVLRKPLGLDFNQDELDEEHGQFHMACLQNGKIAGILLLKEIEKGVLKMRQVAVSPLLQGKGIGRTLVRFSEKWAIDNNYHTIELHARKTAVDFYLGMDYHLEGDEFLEVGIPHMKMTKFLIE
jgi:predicted GNAT family N-acyltransferase